MTSGPSTSSYYYPSDGHLQDTDQEVQERRIDMGFDSECDQQLLVEEKSRDQETKHNVEEDEEGEKKCCRLLNYDELPDYMKENEYIQGYYRAEWPIARAFLSLFSWHNETLNVWTHLLGFLVFLALAVLNLSYHVPEVADFLGQISWPITTETAENVSCSLGNFLGMEVCIMQKSVTSYFISGYHAELQIYQSIKVVNLIHISELRSSKLVHVCGVQGAASFIKLPLSSPSPDTPSEAAERWPFFVFLSGAMFCLLSSSACHLFCCHSHRLNILLLRLDYVGIAVMIIASFFPPIYYIFQCDPHWQLTYLVAISAMGFVTVFTLLFPHLSTGKFRAYRALLFSGMGLFGIVPAVHATVLNWDEPRRNVTLAYEAVMAASYCIGTVFYVSRVPERWKPGRFDLVGHSHQIFHAFVMAGALAHYGAAVVFLQWRDEVGCPRP